MSSGFVTESEAVEARKRRQEEWEKVRSPDQPMERPEEPYDGRSLYDRLKEQKMKKDMDFEEAHKLKNLIRGLDDDEVQFLELVDQSKVAAENKQMREEEKELQEFRNRVATLQEESADKRIKSEIKQPKAKLVTADVGTRPTQKSLLAIGIKRKNGEKVAANCPKTAQPAHLTTDTATNTQPPTTSEPSPKRITTNKYNVNQLKCVAILPGIGTYTESSDSEQSSGSDENPDILGGYDLVGRKRNKKTHCQE